MGSYHNAKQYPRVLVISNNSFSKTSSNGRTLANLFMGWPKDRIAQFCISTMEPDREVCENYYLLTDMSMLYGMKHMMKGKRCDIDNNFGTEGNTVIGGKRISKTPWKALVRHWVWSGKRWNSHQFKEWVQEIDPEVVVVMNSDATFILDIATYISKRRKIPLVMYNTEGFFFLKRLYAKRFDWINEIALKIYQSIYRRHFRIMMNHVVLSVHLNSMLKADYQTEFGGNHMVLYTGSEMVFNPSNLHINSPTFSYLGNFGFDRPSALIEIAEVLQAIDSNYKLDVYGRIPSPDVKAKFDSCPAIVYKGMIPYNEVISVIYKSTILFHAESQAPQFEDSLRYGFSTKIADSISSGHPFLMYSSPNVAGAKYLIESGAGWFAQNRNELKEAIVSILTDELNRNTVLSMANLVAKENHNIYKNKERFVNAISEIRISGSRRK